MDYTGGAPRSGVSGALNMGSSLLLPHVINLYASSTLRAEFLNAL